jgi:hypothetical protein
MIKSLLLLCFVLIAFSIEAQVPNHSFENWTNGNPDSWQTTNIPIHPVSVFSDSDAFSGSLSAKGIVVTGNNGLPIAPYLGIYGPIASGFYISYAYGFAEGQFKLFLNQGDKFQALIRMYDSQLESIGEGSIVVDSCVSTWSPFSIPINYFTSGIPVSCTLYFTISDSTLINSGKAGSYFILDDLNLSGTADVIDPDVKRINVFPNPAIDYINIDMEDNYSHFNYQITDIAGRIIKWGDLQNPVVNVQDINPGNYLINIYNSQERYFRKLIIR